MRLPRRQTQLFTRNWGSGRGSVVTALIVVNVVCFLAQMTAHILAPGWVDEWLGLSASGLRSLRAWQLLSYMFLHGGPMHLLMNMLTLYFAGREVEAIAGPKHLLGIYFLGGLVGGIAQVVFGPGVPLWGASAGVCAVLIAFTTILPEIELTALLFFIIPVRIRARYLALGIVALSVAAIAFHFMQRYGHLAHLGGCLVGWLYAHQLGYGNPWRIQRMIFERRQRIQRFERMPPAQFISQEIDPILDKIAREGLHSLTRAERRVLEKGRDKIESRVSRR